MSLKTKWCYLSSLLNKSEASKFRIVADASTWLMTLKLLTIKQCIMSAILKESLVRRKCLSTHTFTIHTQGRYQTIYFLFKFIRLPNLRRFCVAIFFYSSILWIKRPGLNFLIFYYQEMPSSSERILYGGYFLSILLSKTTVFLKGFSLTLNEIVLCKAISEFIIWRWWEKLIHL